MITEKATVTAKRRHVTEDDLINLATDMESIIPMFVRATSVVNATKDRAMRTSDDGMKLTKVDAEYIRRVVTDALVQGLECPLVTDVLVVYDRYQAEEKRVNALVSNDRADTNFAKVEMECQRIRELYAK